MLVAAMPIDPPDGDRCWAFHVINDESEPFEWIVVDAVSYVWGDFENHETLNLTFGPLAAAERQLDLPTDDNYIAPS